jgi:hypothetical protein
MIQDSLVIIGLDKLILVKCLKQPRLYKSIWYYYYFTDVRKGQTQPWQKLSLTLPVEFLPPASRPAQCPEQRPLEHELLWK